MADVGTGATLEFGTSSFTAEITAINGNNASRPVIDTSHLGTTNARTKMPGDLEDNGEVQFDFQFDPDSQPPLDGATEEITVTFPTPSGGASGATAVFDGFISEWSWGVPLEEKMTASATITISGDITWTASA